MSSSSSRLIKYCAWSLDSLAIKTMDEDPNIDLLQFDGMVFYDTIDTKNLSLLRLLLEYYEKNQLIGDSNSMEYKVAKFKLQQALEYCVDKLKPSEEILEILGKYLPEEEDSSSEQDLSGFDSPPDFEKEIFQSDLDEIRNLNAAISKQCNEWD